MTDAAARREARMRRILENADNRLKKISKLSTPSSNSDEPGDFQETPTLKPPNEVFHHYPDDYERSAPLTKPTVTPKEPEITPRQQQQQQEKNTTVIYNYRAFIIMLLGISVRYMNLIFDQFEYLIGVDLSFMRIEKIFVPILCYELTEVLFFKPFIQESGAFNLLLSLNNINPDKFKKLFRAINFLIGLLKDVSIYFFAFVIIDLLFSMVEV